MNSRKKPSIRARKDGSGSRRVKEILREIKVKNYAKNQKTSQENHS